MVNKKNGTGYQCRKSTVICWQAILSRVTGHDCSTHHPNTVVTGCTSCRFAACDLHLDNEAMRVAVGLRVGCMFCESHTCRYGATVDTLGTHAFSCKCSSSRILRHNYINDVIWRALTRAGVPSMKKPHGLVRDDGKRPEGLTLLPWNSGRSATWDVTAVDTGKRLPAAECHHQCQLPLRLQLSEKETSTAHSAAPTTFFQWHWKHLDP